MQTSKIHYRNAIKVDIPLNISQDILPTNNQSTNPLLRKSTESTNSTLVESTGGRSHH